VIHLILLGFALVAGYLILVASAPTCRCRRCHGKRVVQHWLTRKIIACPRCRATGRQYRPGATAVHRFIAALRTETKDK
jgi:Zn finger protein HypA/HybF involved in hydrogenase expression